MSSKTQPKPGLKGMWHTVWEALTAPFVAVVTGRYKGIPVTRNPIAWIPSIVVGILMIPFILVLYPLILVAGGVLFFFSGPSRTKDNLPAFLDLLEECENTHMSDSGLDFGHWRELASSGQLHEAAREFLSEATSRRLAMPPGHWRFLRKLVKLNDGK